MILRAKGRASTPSLPLPPATDMDHAIKATHMISVCATGLGMGDIALSVSWGTLGPNALDWLATRLGLHALAMELAIIQVLVHVIPVTWEIFVKIAIGRNARHYVLRVMKSLILHGGFGITNGSPLS